MLLCDWKFFWLIILMSQWMDEDIPKKVIKETINVGDYSHLHLKVMELIGFTGCRHETELVFHLLEIAASIEKIVIHVCLPSPNWANEDMLRYEENQYNENCRR